MGKTSGIKRSLGAAALGACLAGCVAVPVNERVFFYPPQVAQKASDPSQMRLWREEWITGPFPDEQILDGQLSYREGRLPATVTHELAELGGERIAISRIKASNADPGEPLIVHCGGNATDRISTGGYYTYKVLPWGELLLFDYPGYGDSTGRPTVQAFDAMLNDMAELVDRQAQGRPLVLWGHSIGGLICARLANVSQEADAVILETSALSPATMVKSKTRWIPFVDVQVRGGFETYDVGDLLAGFRGPVMVVGAGKDRTLPVALSRSLSQALADEGLDVTYHEYADASHMDAGYTRAFETDARAFFQSVSDGRNESSRTALFSR